MKTPYPPCCTAVFISSNKSILLFPEKGKQRRLCLIYPRGNKLSSKYKSHIKQTVKPKVRTPWPE